MAAYGPAGGHRSLSRWELRERRAGELKGCTEPHIHGKSRQHFRRNQVTHTGPFLCFWAKVKIGEGREGGTGEKGGDI